MAEIFATMRRCPKVELVTARMSNVTKQTWYKRTANDAERVLNRLLKAVDAKVRRNT